MKVRVKFFAVLRERVGSTEVSVEVADGSTVQQLWNFLCSDYPLLPRSNISLLYAVNKNYVSKDQILQDQDEVVFVPPVSGG